MVNPDPPLENPRKRFRPSSEEVEEKPFTNHPALYFEDGNVILTAGTTLFCVHRSLLSKHSPVFRDLFEQKHEQFRGLVQITMEETREDLEAILGVIYDGLRFDVNELTVETFPILATLLRMGKKYMIEKPCQDIIARIRLEWPDTLLQHDTKQAFFRAELQMQAAPEVQHPGPPSPNLQPQPQPGQRLPQAALTGHYFHAPAQGGPAQRAPVAEPRRAGVGGVGGGPGCCFAGPAGAAEAKEDLIVHPASVIGLLRECGYTEADLFFPLFYALSRTTWQFGGSALGHHLAPLGTADVERLVVGVERLRARHFALVAAQPCALIATNPPHFCMPGVTQLWFDLVIQRLAHGPLRALGPLEEQVDIIKLVSTQYGRYHICADCCLVVTTRIEAYRQQTWTSLAAFFELV